MGDAIADVRIRVAAAMETEFDELVSHCESPLDVVAYFLALLELARWGVVSIAQDHRDAPIAIVSKDPQGFDAGALQSEWSER